MGTIKSAPNDSLFLLGSLVRSLSHELRSPLSVLVNDLTYLKSRYPAEHVDRTLAHVDKISELLKKACKIGDGTLELQSWSIKEILAAAGFETSKCGEISVLVDLKTTVLALRWLGELLDSLSNEAKTEVQIAPGILEFCKPISAAGKGQFSSLTSFCSEALRKDLLIAPLIDAIFEAQLIELKISSGDKLTVKLELK